MPANVARVSREQFVLVFTRTLIYVVLLLIVIVEAFPLAWMLLTSVKNQREVFSSFLTQTLDLSNFRRILVAIDLPTHLVNSLYVTSLTVVIVVCVATSAGYAFARYNFRGRDILFYIFLGAT